MRTWRDGIWNPAQRTVVAGILVALLALLTYRHLTRPTYLPNPLRTDGPRAHELVSRLNPNAATWEQIALLPNLGEKKAKAIVAYRDQYLADHPGDLAFRTPDDLTKIKGIGDATVANLSPYLAFPTEPEH